MYKKECAVCHGLPKQPLPNIAAGMFPKPPQLFQHGVTDDPPGETYWKVSNGIRLTGMPAFKKTYSDDAVWQVSLMLANADKLPASVTAALNTPINAPLSAPVSEHPAVPPPQTTVPLPIVK